MGSQKVAKFLLWLNAAVWFGFGIGYTVVPDVLASLVGGSISRADGYLVLTDIGVMMVGIAVWYGYCAVDESRTRLGLVSALLICVGLLAGRLVAMALSGSVNPLMIAYAVLEALDSVLLFLAVRAGARAATAPSLG